MSETLFIRRVRFRASHHYALPSLSFEENRARFGETALPHHHDWQVTVYLTADPDPQTGMVVDLQMVDRALQEVVITPFSDQHINDVDACFERQMPCTEVLAQYWAKRLIPRLLPARLVKLRVAESELLCSEFIP